MKFFFKILFCLFITLPAFSQEKIDSTAKKKNKCHVGYYFSGGINMIRNSEEFIKYLYEKGDHEPADVKCGNSNGYVFKLSWKPTPIKFDHHEITNGPIVNIGLEFKSGSQKKITFHHLMEVSYIKSKGEYSFINYYEESYSVGPAMGYAKIYDTVQTKYTNNILSFGYKFQPVFKFIFLSFGVTSSLNLLNVVQQKGEQIDCKTEYEQSGQYSESDWSFAKTSDKYQFANFSLQLGTGCYIKIKKILLKPAFYYSPNFIKFVKEYDFYSASITLLYYK